jgi:rhodanese-related sulfurtransferase
VANPDQISARELEALRSRGDDLAIVDVREPFEVQIASIAGSVVIPMNEIPARIDELDPERPTVVLCHHGIRSAQVATYLARMGFARVINLAGGIDAWSEEVDPRVPRY